MTYDLLLIAILTPINNETLSKSCNFYPLLIAELIQTITVQEGLPQTAPSISYIMNIYFQITIIVINITIKILLVGGAVIYSGVSTFSDGKGLQIDYKVTGKFLDIATIVQCCELLFFSTKTTNNETKRKFIYFLVYDYFKVGNFRDTFS